MPVSAADSANHTPLIQSLTCAHISHLMILAFNICTNAQLKVHCPIKCNCFFCLCFFKLPLKWHRSVSETQELACMHTIDGYSKLLKTTTKPQNLQQNKKKRLPLPRRMPLIRKRTCNPITRWDLTSVWHVRTDLAVTQDGLCLTQCELLFPCFVMFCFF